ncbi:hypothetical protein [Microcoleus sp. EPA2]|uniref:hypothetical protein n=1 Tax=Microcoleus sp. EPA2 TaxID=2841654 RepID=UPI00312B9C81
MEWPKIVAISIHENKPGVTAKFSFTVSLTNNTPAPLLNSAIVITAIVGWFRRFITTKLTVITWIDLV